MRSLFVDQDTLAHLAMWKKFQANALARIGMKEDGVPLLAQTDATPVCCTDTGSWLDPANLGRWWNRYRKEIGLPDFRMYELRHTQATMLLGNGVDVKTVQTRLGHSTSALTLDQYAHAIPANDKAAADLMGSIYGKSANSHASQNPPSPPQALAVLRNRHKGRFPCRYPPKYPPLWKPRKMARAFMPLTSCFLIAPTRFEPATSALRVGCFELSPNEWNRRIFGHGIGDRLTLEERKR